MAATLPQRLSIVFQPDKHLRSYDLHPNGAPHVTLDYIPSHERKDSNVRQLAATVIDSLPVKASFTEARIDDFVMKMTGEPRYDVILLPSEETLEFINRVKQEAGIPPGRRVPHVRVASFRLPEEAEIHRRTWAQNGVITGEFIGVTLR